MGRNVGPKCRLCRREGEKLFLKGPKCYTEKCPVTRRNSTPGLQPRGRRRQSQYAIHLREKQKLKRIYGVREAQFRTYVAVAKRAKGVTGDRILELLESRLDSILYRGGMAASRDQARQLINHGHIWVNERRVDIASFLAKAGDVVSVKEASRGKKGVQSMVSEHQRKLTSWLERQNGQLRVVDKPKPSEIEQEMQMSLIVEFYSR
ncbi:30S ribosomal protein S4 [Candidatus Acetothermia bacterium]|nr:30S ribosomal protein S4 [Candidatus Acetothermia bacterium]MBI3642892.1 30S ribosomal protein S4 [Candidatus Acetothermia bacterium]